MLSYETGPIGVFDSGYGGLTVLKEIVKILPGYDYLYLGDNARAPYGGRSFDTVYQYTVECVKWFFAKGCPLVILACNTASAKALRTIQQVDLPAIAPMNKVLGVIRPTAEVIGSLSKTHSIGIMGTNGTIRSESYILEIKKFFPDLSIVQQACPMWVPLVENNEFTSEGAEYFIKNDIQSLLNQNPDIDTILLACTHYPLLIDKILEHLPAGIQVVSQGQIVAQSLVDYLQRHPEIETRCLKRGKLEFYTTDTPEDFDEHSTLFFGSTIRSTHTSLE